MKQDNHHSIALLWINTTYLHYLIIYLLWASVSFQTASKLTKGYNDGSSYVYSCIEKHWISVPAATQLNNIKVVLFILIKNSVQSSDTKSSLRTAISASTTNANSECTIHCNSPHNLTKSLLQQWVTHMLYCCTVQANISQTRYMPCSAWSRAALSTVLTAH